MKKGFNITGKSVKDISLEIEEQRLREEQAAGNPWQNRVRSPHKRYRNPTKGAFGKRRK